MGAYIEDNPVADYAKRNLWLSLDLVRLMHAGVQMTGIPSWTCFIDNQVLKQNEGPLVGT